MFSQISYLEAQISYLELGVGTKKPTNLDPFTFYMAPEILLQDPRALLNTLWKPLPQAKGSHWHAEQGSNTWD